jgi:hypothetical protein
MGAADTKTTLTWVLKDEVSGPAKGIGSSLSGLVNPATVAAAGIGVLTLALGEGIKSAMETEKIQAQTAAVLASTGNAANLTAAQIGDLAQSISDYSGIDDQAVQEGENLLLTFTNIQDKAGEGNDIFTQATEIMADMATAMGTDMSSQAIQLGKALNDPIAGVGALSRVGVTFTDEQKEMIRSMQEAGNTAGAQAVIMAELTKEFGGSAEAAGNTTAGAMDRLKNKMDDLFESVGTALLPKITEFADFALETLIPAVEDAVAAVGPGLSDAFKLAGDGVDVFMGLLQPLLDLIEKVDGAALSLGDALGVVAGIISPTGTLASQLQRDAMGGAGSGTLTKGRTGGRASGGPVDPYGVYTIGETGPETLVMGGSPGMVIPGTAPGGSPVEIPVYIDGQEVARIVDKNLYYRLQTAIATPPVR